MCGLVGIMTTALTKDEVSFFKQALLVGMVRGYDSTGVAAITEGGIEVKKNNTNSLYFLEGTLAKVIDRPKYTKPAIFMGHNRAATVGACSPENAHPFTQGSLTLAHNGTLRNKYKLEKGNSFETDSEALTWEIAHVGMEKTIEKVDGAFALTWWDAEFKTLNFLRNSERTLYIAEGNGYVAWASEELMLKWMLSRNNLKAVTLAILPVGEFRAYNFDDIEKPLVKKIKLYENPPPVVKGIAEKINKASTKESFVGVAFERYGSSHWGAILGYLDSPAWEDAELVGINEDDAQCIIDGDPIEVDITLRKIVNGKDVAICKLSADTNTKKKKLYDVKYAGPTGKLIGEEDMRQLVQAGCFRCGIPFAVKDYDFVSWDRGHPICECCDNEGGYHEIICSALH